MPSGAAIGADDSAEDIAPVDDNDDSERECGLRLHAQALFDKFVETLSPAAQGYARLLFNTHTSTWDVDFMKIANAEMQRLEFSYGFAELFKITQGINEEDEATVAVSKLREACQDWVKTTQPKRIDETESEASATGDGDSAASHAGYQDKDSQCQTLFEQRLGITSRFHAFRTPQCTQPSLNAAWRDISEVKKQVAA